MCQSGLSCFLGKEVLSQINRRFESCHLREKPNVYNRFMTFDCQTLVRHFFQNESILDL